MNALKTENMSDPTQFRQRIPHAVELIPAIFQQAAETHAILSSARSRIK
jgi:hypothetical protein